MYRMRKFGRSRRGSKSAAQLRNEQLAEKRAMLDSQRMYIAEQLGLLHSHRTRRDTLVGELDGESSSSDIDIVKALELLVQNYNTLIELRERHIELLKQILKIHTKMLTEEISATRYPEAPREGSVMNYAIKSIELNARHSLIELHEELASVQQQLDSLGDSLAVSDTTHSGAIVD